MSKETIAKIVMSKQFAVFMGSAVAAATSAVVTNRYLRREIGDEYAEISLREIQEAKEIYQRRYRVVDMDLETIANQYAEEPAADEEVEDEFSPRLGMVEEAARIMSEQEYVSYDKASKEAPGVPVVNEDTLAVEESIRSNIWESKTLAAEGGFDIDVELEKMREGRPYIIEHDEFMENDSGFEQIQLTWYEGDSVLVDPHDQPINNTIAAIGSDSMHFGRGSKDDNIVYIRNDRLEKEYEVIRSNGKFAEEMGFIEHSDKRPLPRFRLDAD